MDRDHPRPSDADFQAQLETLEELEENVRDAYRLMMAEEGQPSRTGAQIKELTLEAP